MPNGRYLNADDLEKALKAWMRKGGFDVNAAMPDYIVGRFLERLFCVNG